MTGPRHRRAGRRAGFAAVLLAAGALMAGAASAQMVPSAERGATPLVTEAPIGLDAPVTVASGETAWRETLRPRYVVRTLEDAVERRRPSRIDGPPAGTLMYGVQLSTGYAYCPPIDYDAPTRRVQCYRDFDDDGRFDGGYMTEHRTFRTQFLPSMVRSLAAVPKVSYETAQPDETMTADARIVFEGFRRGKAQFRLYVEEERTDSRTECEPAGEESTQCTAFGLLLDVREQDGRAVIALVEPAGPRLFSLYSRGDL